MGLPHEHDTWVDTNKHAQHKNECLCGVRVCSLYASGCECVGLSARTRYGGGCGRNTNKTLIHKHTTYSQHNHISTQSQRLTQTHLTRLIGIRPSLAGKADSGTHGHAVNNVTRKAR